VLVRIQSRAQGLLCEAEGLFCLGVVKACIDKIELEIIYYMLSNHGQTEKPSDTEWSEGLG
jgi:hypothetical protein